jgi:hypothetical protein
MPQPDGDTVSPFRWIYITGLAAASQRCGSRQPPSAAPNCAPGRMLDPLAAICDPGPGLANTFPDAEARMRMHLS